MKKRKQKFFTKKKKKKLEVLFGITLVLFAAVAGSILWVQNVRGEEYKKKVLSQQNFVSRTIPFQRGDIKDCNGNLLATSQKVYNVMLDCRLLDKLGEESIGPAVAALADCFPEHTQEELRRILKQNKNNAYYTLESQKNFEEVRQMKEILSQPNDEKYEERYKGIAGVWLLEDYRRIYPGGTLACDIIGFTNKNTSGQYGIEKSYDAILNGENGKEYGYIDLDSGIESLVQAPVDGRSVVTTIDSNVQQIVEKHIRAFNEAHTNEVREGCGSLNTGVIIQNPNTGEIIAEASYPVFDLNNRNDLTTAGITAADLEKLERELQQKALSGQGVTSVTDPAAMPEVDVTTEAMSAVWKNFCVNDTFEPGSTAKILTIATGIETGKLTGDEVYLCDGYEEVGGHTIHCVNQSGHGNQTVVQALMNSCNDALMQMSYVIGIDAFTKYQTAFGIGKRTTIDLPSEPNTSQLIYTKETMKPVDLATSSFGQTFNVTMTQMMSAFCSVINGGYFYQPHVVKKIESSSGTTVETIEPKLMRKTISKETSEILKGYLKEVVMNGTAKSAQVPGYSMGGKTGTAEKVENGVRKEDCYVLSFIGCVPADDPQIAIYVVIDEPNVAEQAHSSYAQVLARDILTEVLPYMNIFPDLEQTQEPEQAPDAGQAAEPVYEPQPGMPITE